MAGDPVTFPGDLIVLGRLLAGSMTLATNSVYDATVVAAANIAASKLEHQYQPVIPISNHATGAAVMRLPAYNVRGATGTITRFAISASVPAAAAGSATVDLLKNGTSVLSAPIVLDDTVAANVDVVATISTPGLVVGDRLDVSVTAIAGTPPKGVGAWLQIREKAQ
jgi:hypothetical protein